MGYLAKKILKSSILITTEVSLYKFLYYAMSAVKLFRIISTMEGISFLLLLGIAMPLKYIFDIPEMVQVVGMTHGVLFLLYIAGAVYVSQLLGWSFKTLAIVVSCSLIPFGPFYVDKKYLG